MSTVNVNVSGGGGGGGAAVIAVAVVIGVIASMSAIASMVTALAVAVASILTAAIWGTTAIVCTGIAAKAVVVVHAQRTDMIMARDAQAAALQRQRLTLSGPVTRPVVIEQAPTRKAIR